MTLPTIENPALIRWCQPDDNGSRLNRLFRIAVQHWPEPERAYVHDLLIDARVLGDPEAITGAPHSRVTWHWFITDVGTHMFRGDELWRAQGSISPEWAHYVIERDRASFDAGYHYTIRPGDL